MIIDLILDRKEDAEYNGIDTYNAHDFYIDCLEYDRVMDGIADGIINAMDYGSETDVKRELCKYVLKNGYNKKICDYINSVNWLD